MEKQSFVFYKEWRDAIQDLPDDVRLEFYEAVIGYALTGELRGLKPMAGIAFNFVRPRIDRDKEEYQSIIERNRGNGMLGGRPRKNPEKPKKPSGLSGLSEKPRETQRNPKNPDHDNDHEYDYDYEKEQKRDTDVSPESPDPLNPVIPEPEETHPPVAPPPIPDPDFLKFQKWILEKAPQVAKLKEPFTEEEYLRIKEEFPPGMTAEVLLAMHNCKDLLKKYVSANLTFRNWIKRRIDDGKNANNRKPDKASDEDFARELATVALEVEYEHLDRGRISEEEFRRRTGIEPVPRQYR